MAPTRFGKEMETVLLNDAENKAAGDFARSHYEGHCHRKNRVMALRLSADQTGMGYIVKVTCPYCKEEKDITDYDVW